MLHLRLTKRLGRRNAWAFGDNFRWDIPNLEYCLEKEFVRRGISSIGYPLEEEIESLVRANVFV